MGGGPICPRCGGARNQAIAPGIYGCLSAQVIGVARGPFGPQPVHQRCVEVFRWGQPVGHGASAAERAQACQVDDCGYPAAGTCRSCRRPYCDFHRSTTAPDPLGDPASHWCGPCDDRMRTQFREDEEASRRKLLALAERLRAAGVESEPLYAHDADWPRRRFLRTLAATEKFPPRGFGWDIGTFDWRTWNEDSPGITSSRSATTVLVDELLDPNDQASLRDPQSPLTSQFSTAVRLVDDDGDFLVVAQTVLARHALTERLGDNAPDCETLGYSILDPSATQQAAIIAAVDALIDLRGSGRSGREG